jgi:hypothetical protein
VRVRCVLVWSGARLANRVALGCHSNVYIECTLLYVGNVGTLLEYSSMCDAKGKVRKASKLHVISCKCTVGLRSTLDFVPGGQAREAANLCTYSEEP